jgi:hypothetical protein
MGLSKVADSSVHSDIGYGVLVPGGKRLKIPNFLPKYELRPSCLPHYSAGEGSCCPVVAPTLILNIYEVNLNVWPN